MMSLTVMILFHLALFACASHPSNFTVDDNRRSLSFWDDISNAIDSLTANNVVCGRLYEHRDRGGAVKTLSINGFGFDKTTSGSGWPFHDSYTWGYTEVSYSDHSSSSSDSSDDWFNDEMSSTWVAPNCLIRFYEHGNYEGHWNFHGCRNIRSDYCSNSCTSPGTCNFNGHGDWYSSFRCYCRLACDIHSNSPVAMNERRERRVHKYHDRECNEMVTEHRTCLGYDSWGEWTGTGHTSCFNMFTVCQCANGTPKTGYPHCPSDGDERCSICNAGHTLKTEADGRQSCVLSPWSEWTPCSKSCTNPIRDPPTEFDWVQSRDTSPGTQSRTRSCGGTACEGEIEVSQDCNLETACIHACDRRWCNNRGETFGNDDRRGCSCECALGWSNEDDVGPHNEQCTKASFCDNSCYEIETQEECEVTGVYADLGNEFSECPLCYWHGSIMGCLHEREYVQGWNIQLNYDPKTIPLEAVTGRTYRSVYTYSNLNVEEMTVPHIGYNIRISETTAIIEEDSWVALDGTTVSWEDFKSNVRSHMEGQTTSNTERTEWHEKETDRTMHSQTTGVELCIKGGIAAPATGGAFSEKSACMSHTSEYLDENIVENYQGGSFEQYQEDVGKQEESWEIAYNEASEDWYTDEKAEVLMTESTVTQEYVIACNVEEFTIRPLSTHQVLIGYSTAEYAVEAHATADIITTRKSGDEMSKTLRVDFGTVLVPQSHSECNVEIVPGQFITEKYECEMVQNAVMVWNLRDLGTFSPRCMLPPQLYEPLQQTQKVKWCSTPHGVKQANSHTPFDQIDTLVASGVVLPVYDDPDNYPLDCSAQLSQSQLCVVSVLDLGEVVPFSNQIERTLREYSSSQLLDDYPVCQGSFPGLQELLKINIPPRTQVWVKATSDTVDVTLIARFGDLCPGMSAPTTAFENVYYSNEQEDCNPSIVLQNADMNEEFTAYVVIATNALPQMSGSTVVQIEYKTAPYRNQKHVQCRRTPEWWIQSTPRDDVSQWGCDYYDQGSGDNHLECAFDGINTVNGFITAADVCPSCGCVNWRETCPQVTEDWACNCSWDVEDCYGECGGCDVKEDKSCEHSICVEECDFDYGRPGMTNLEKQSELTGRRRNIYKGGDAGVDEYPWFVQVGHLGKAHYVNSIPIVDFMSSGDDMEYSQDELEDAFIPICGGTMIGRSAIITAAHCVMAFKWFTEDGELADEERRITHVSLRHGTTIVPIKRIIFHKHFNRKETGGRVINDVAILEIEPVPCGMRFQAIEILDNFEINGCTAFLSGAGEEKLRHVPPTASPVAGPDVNYSPDCSCANDYEDDGTSEQPSGEYYYDADETTEDPDNADDAILSTEEQARDCSDFTEADREYCSDNIAQFVRRIYENGELTYGNYPDVGYFKEMITKVWTAETCNSHEENMYPMKDQRLFDETVCAWTGDFTQHIMHPETVCNGDSGSGLKIDMDISATSHHYALAGLLSYGRAGGCTADSVPVYALLSSHKEFIHRVYPGAHFVAPTECDRKDYFEGTDDENTIQGQPATYNERLHTLGVESTFSAFYQKYLGQQCPFPLNSRLNILVKGLGNYVGSFTVRTAVNFGNGQSSMNSRPLTISEQGWLPLYFDRNKYACNPYRNSLVGKIAFARRGRCAFSDKFENAMTAGALAMIVVDTSSSPLVGMQAHGFDNDSENGPAMFMARNHGNRIRRALESNQDVTVQMECADLEQQSLWISEDDQNVSNAEQLHPVEFCEDSPLKTCNNDILCVPLCQQENECAMRLGSCCEYDCARWVSEENPTEHLG